MGNVQIIVTEGGEELAVLPRREYDRLAAIAAEAEEDAGTARVIDRVKQEIAEGREAYLPAEVGRPSRTAQIQCGSCVNGVACRKSN
jgi:hypothetical protein